MEEIRSAAPTAPPHIPPAACGEEPRELTFSAEEVARDYGSRVFSVARRMLGSDTDAEDVTQDVLLQVVRKLPTFRGEAALPTWLHRVTVNAALMHRRKRSNRDMYANSDALEAALSEDIHGGPEEEALDRETREIVDRAIADLPEAYRHVFVLADIDELPNAEIGTRLGLSLPAVKSRLHRARQMLRQALAPHFEEALV